MAQDLHYRQVAQAPLLAAPPSCTLHMTPLSCALTWCHLHVSAEASGPPQPPEMEEKGLKGGSMVPPSPTVRVLSRLGPGGAPELPKALRRLGPRVECSSRRAEGDACHGTGIESPRLPSHHRSLWQRTPKHRHSTSVWPAMEGTCCPADEKEPP